MCEPITLISAAATVAGSLLQQNAAQKAAKAQADTMALERQRQQRLQERQEALARNSLERSDRQSMDEDMAAAKTEREDLYTNLIQDEATADATGQQFDAVVNNKVVQDEMDRRKGSTRDRSLNMAGLRAALDSFGDASFNQAIARGRNAEEIGMYNNFARGSAGVLPAELQAAGMTGSGQALLGSLLGTAGQVGMFAGGAGLDNIRNIFSTGKQAAGTGVNFLNAPVGGPGVNLARVPSGGAGIRLPQIF